MYFHLHSDKFIQLTSASAKYEIVCMIKIGSNSVSYSFLVSLNLKPQHNQDMIFGLYYQTHAGCFIEENRIIVWCYKQNAFLQVVSELRVAIVINMLCAYKKRNGYIYIASLPKEYYNNKKYVFSQKCMFVQCYKKVNVANWNRSLHHSRNSESEDITFLSGFGQDFIVRRQYLIVI